MTSDKLSVGDTITIDGTEYEVIEDGDDYTLRKPYSQRKRDLISEHDGGPYVAEVDVDWAVFYELADRKRENVADVTVSPQLLQDFAERVNRMADGDETVRLTVSYGLPMVASFADDTDVALSPRDTHE